MRAVVTRVNSARVTRAETGEVLGEIGKGFLVLLGVHVDDTEKEAAKIADRICGLRVFDDENGVMNLSVKDIKGEILVVSQFTLMASYKKGNRPSYIRAAGHDVAIPLYEKFCEAMDKEIEKPVKTGTFGADMKVELLNDGPVTICMDTKNKE